MALVTVVAGLVAAAPAARAALPSGVLTSPVPNASFGPGEQITLTVEATDTGGETGPEPGVRIVEWWLYADGTKGAPTDFSTQYPGNGQDKVLIGVSEVPVGGTAAEGTWTATWTVPTEGYYDGERDGDHTTPIPDDETRRYDMPSGVYEIQGHMIDDEWLANPGAPGFTSKQTVVLDTGAGLASDPDPSPSPSPSRSLSPSRSSNLVSNGDLESGGDVPTCFTAYGWGDHDVAWTITNAAHSGARAQQLTVSAHASGDRKLMMSADDPCAPTVTPGERYDLSVWYTSTTASASLTLFRHSDAGWTYWTDLERLPAAGAWTEATAITPPIPDGTDRIMWGVSLSGDGTLVTDDYAMIAHADDPSPPPPADDELIVNGDLEAGSSTPTCFARAGWGDHDVSQGFVDGHSGRGWHVTIDNYVNGDHKLLTSEDAGCAPAVAPGNRYELSIWYTSTAATTSFTVFRHTAAGWQYWTDLRTLPVASEWTQATATLPEIPAGTDRIAWGVSLHGNGTLVTDDYSMREQSDEPPAGDLAETGRWTVLESPMPIRTIHSTLLRDGRVLLIAGSGNDPALFDAGSFRSVIWDPGDNSFDDVPTPNDMFCAGHVTLPDGRILVAGGTQTYPGNEAGATNFEGTDESYIFDPATNEFQASNSMADAHWYPTMTKLENGDVWSAGGLNASGHGTVATEMFDYSAERWLSLGEVPQTWSFWGTYPHMYLMTDGRLFYSGAHTFGNGLPGTGASIYDWRRASITDVQGLRDKDLRDQAGSVLLPPAQDQRVMIVGGGNTDTNAAATNTVDIIDLKQPVPVYTAGPDLPGAGKGYVNTLVLPDRTVLAANGARHNRADDVLTAAIYDPPTNTWASIAADPIGRNYHSTALTLPDGRVAVFGSNPLDNSFDLRISVYEPPYLFKGDRPQVTQAPVSVTYGESFAVGVAGDVQSASLLAPMSVTHQTDTNARLVDLPIAGTGDTRQATAPSNPALLPPGPYMLTVLDGNGVPSEARWLIVR
jgi:hypothetical protein